MSNDDHLFNQLTLNSLIILGFNIEYYANKFPSLGFNLSPLSLKSFDRTNEKMFLVIMHFLLHVIDSNKFHENIKSRWPYNDMKSKAEYKKIIYQSVNSIQKENPEIFLDLKIMQILNHSKGKEVWKMLRILSDIAMDTAITQFEMDEHFANEDILKYSIDSVNSYDSNLDKIQYNISKEDLVSKINVEFEVIASLVSSCIDREDNQYMYIHELEQRLKKANKSMEISKRSLNEISQSKKLKILSDSAKKERSDIVQRIMELKQTFDEHSDMSLVENVMAVVNEFKLTPEYQNHLYKLHSNLNSLESKSMIAESNENNIKKIPLSEAIESLILQIEEVGDRI